MGKRDPRVDAYIAKSADFAKPILEYLRETVHAAVPEVEEDIKWGVPHFAYKGMFCGVAAFKQHCTFGFWKGSLVLGNDSGPDPMAQFGRLTKVSDLPPKSVLVGYLEKAKQLNDEGVKVERPPARPKAPLRTPAALAAALRKNKKAQTTFEAFSPSHKREYIEWIVEAKSDETRNRRLATAIDWMAQGKPRNWKYMK